MRFSICWSLLLLSVVSTSVSADDVSVQLDAGSGFSVKNSAGTVDRLRVHEATGNVSRNGSLFVHTTGSTTNTFVGSQAGGLGTTGTRNSAFGNSALGFTTTGNYNSAFGQSALRATTTGSRNSAFGSLALVNNNASDNSAFGNFALFANTSGTFNSAFGEEALLANTTGNYNSAFGKDALRVNTSSANSAFGSRALRSNAGGAENTAIGSSALFNNTTGFDNTAVGADALHSLASGANNIAIGVGAGFFTTTGNHNIFIGNRGFAGDTTKIRIGYSPNQTETFIAGIFGNAVSGGSTVIASLNGELGTVSSSIRFKEDVRDMGDASDKLRKLRPVVFRYRAEEGQPPSDFDEYGLIAEEVATVAPELVVPGADGKPYSVRYHVLPALLLNEMQAQQRTIEKQEHAIETQERALDEQRAQIAALSERLERVEAGAR